MNDSFWQAAYIIAALCVVLSIKWLSSPVSARKGVLAGEFGMLLAVIGLVMAIAAAAQNGPRRNGAEGPAPPTLHVDIGAFSAVGLGATA